MPFRRYTVLTALGSAIWCFGFAGVGWALGASWETLHHDFRYVEFAVVAGIVAVVAYLIVRRRRSTTMSPACSRFPTLTSRRSTRRSSRS